MASHRPPLSPCQKLGLPNNEELKHDLGETPKFIKKHLGTPGGTAERENPHISAAFPVFEDVTYQDVTFQPWPCQEQTWALHLAGTGSCTDGQRHQHFVHHEVNGPE